MKKKTIPLFYSVVASEVKKLTALKIEYYFVDDGSEDNTLSVLRKLHTNNKEVHYISFSRNFGKDAALYAGLQASSGDYVVDMDADLQDPPALLPKMYALLKTGKYDCIGTRRIDRKGESKVKSFLSNLFL